MFGMNKPIPLEVSAQCYDEIALALVNSGAHVKMTDAMLDMSSVGLVRGPDDEPVVPVHRPISGRAPGAI